MRVSNPALSAYPLRSPHIRVRFKQDDTPDIPPPPNGVPEEFKTVWDKLPPCCRNFYLHPNTGGCCAGRDKPQPAMMNNSAPIQISGEKPTTPTVVPASVKRSWFQALKAWVKGLIQSIIQDIKQLFGVSKPAQPTKKPLTVLS